MTEKTHNQKLKKDINDMIEGRVIEINGYKTPLLGNATSRIILECRDSKISAIRPEYKIVK